MFGVGAASAQALDGGSDGLVIIGRLIDALPGALAPAGAALLEIGGDQEPGIMRLLGDRLPGWSIDVRRDLGGLPRVVRVARIAAEARATASAQRPTS